MQCERLEAACKMSYSIVQSDVAAWCVICVLSRANSLSVPLFVIYSGKTTPHTCIHERFRCDTAFNGRPQNTRQIISVAQLCDAQCLCEHDYAGLCSPKTSAECIAYGHLQRCGIWQCQLHARVAVQTNLQVVQVWVQ